MFRIKIHYLSNIFLALSCSTVEKSPTICFYYWKTTFKLNKTEKSTLKHYNVKTLYIRYFDVDINKLDQKPFPLSPIRFDEKPDSFRVVPVVYIKNKVMLHKNLNLDSLSINIISLINKISKNIGIGNDEIQIDCDWSLESRDSFMKFIELLKKKWNKILSVTIRLHQVKYYFKTKIPVADYGVLMYYNMGKIAADTLNSIYDSNIAQRYIQSLKGYPLRLDVALPIFSQGTHIENRKVLNMTGKISLLDFTNDTNYSQVSNNRFIVKKPNFKSGLYFKQNDEIKIESVSFDQLMEMAEDLSKSLRKRPEKIIFFDLDSINLKNYQYENQNFSEIINCF